jgi:hypothetical protein
MLALMFWLDEQVLAITEAILPTLQIEQQKGFSAAGLFDQLQPSTAKKCMKNRDDAHY